MRISVKQLIHSGVFAVIVFLATLTGSFAQIGNGAYIHIGDALIYTAALFLPTPFAVGAAVIGASFADLLIGSAIYVPITIVTKAAVVCFAKLMLKYAKTPLSQDVLISLSGSVNILGYFLAEWGMFGIGQAASGIMFNALQALASAVVFIIIATPARKIYKRYNKDV